MATKVWKGHLQFGLVSIPVYMNTAARDERVSLNTFHTCGGGLKKPYFCPACNCQPPKEEILKGYKVDDAHFIPITEDELDSITPETGKVMEISECVQWEQVDPIYLAESFYMLPEEPGRKAYSLLVKALGDSRRVAITHVTKNGREHVVLIRPRGNGLMVHFIYYPNEVNRVAEFDDLAAEKISATEAKLAQQLLDELNCDFEPSQYEDGYAQRLNALIASKLDKSVAAPAPVKTVAQTQTADITAALMASLQAAKPKRSIALHDEPAVAPKKSAAAKKGGRKTA